jgi:signal peptidase I
MSVAVESGGDTARVGSEQSPAPLPEVFPEQSGEQPAAFGASIANEAPAVEAAPATTVAHRHGLLQSFQSLVNLVVIALFIITFTVQPFRIPSASMEPTLLVGDFLLVNKQVGPERSPHIFPPSGEIHRGDVVVFHYPVNASLHLVKRVIGLPGDRIRLRDSRVYINGSVIAESYAAFRPSMPDSYRDDFPRLVSADPGVDSRWWIQMRSLVSQGELTVPPDNYFVLGDNRNDSEDSRYWGFVPRGAIIGKPVLVYFSLNDDGVTTGQATAAAMTGQAAQHQRTSDSVIDFARWDRALHIVR